MKQNLYQQLSSLAKLKISSEVKQKLVLRARERLEISYLNNDVNQERS